MRGHRDGRVARDRREAVQVLLQWSQGTHLSVLFSCSSTPLSTSPLLFEQAGDGYVCPGCGTEDASAWPIAKGFLLCHDGQMVKQGDGGAIVAISSISALVGGEMQTHYTPTKAGVHSLMQSCAVALGQYGIRCNSVLPGTIATDINKDDLSDPAKRTYMEGRIPLGRLGRPEDIASVVAFLASDMAGYMSGAALLVDGGAFANFQ